MSAPTSAHHQRRHHHLDGRPKRSSRLIKQRHLIGLMAILCSVVCYVGRQNLSLAITAMVKDPATLQAGQNNSSIATLVAKGQEQLEAALVGAQTNSNNLINGDEQQHTCPRPVAVDEQGEATLAEAEQEPSSFGPQYEWGPEKSLLFEAFFWSYVACQVPGARLAESLGPKWILAGAGLGTSLLNLMSPWAASASVYALAAVRLLMGACQAALYPACYVLYCRWLPPSERSCLIPLLGVGAYLGSIVTSISAGYFIEQAAFGWPYAFYMPALVCGLWSLVWIYIGTSEPGQSKRISLEELDYIECRLEPRMEPTQQQQQQQEAPKISWKKLAKSQALWAISVASFASGWSFSIVLILLPTYLKDILFVGPLENGFINSMVYVLFVISAPVVGALSTMMTESRPCRVSRLNVRKLFEGVALFGQAACFLLLPWFACDPIAVKALLFAMIVLYSFTNGGEVQVTTELSVDFPGTICAIGNCISSSTGFIVPRVHSLIVRDSRDRTQWDSFFYLAASVNILGGLIFCIFGRNDMQDYALDHQDDDDDDQQQQWQQRQHGDHEPNESYQSVGEPNNSYTWQGQQSKLTICSSNEQQKRKTYNSLAKSFASN